MDKTCAIVLAAGDGKRMKSKKSKVLCEVLFKPMISWVADAVKAAGINHCCVVVSPEGEADIAPLLPEGFTTATQSQRLGTGHAASMAADYIREGGFTEVLVLFGDGPFFTAPDISQGLAEHRRSGNSVTLYGTALSHPAGYGRLVQENGSLRIVEEKDATEQQRNIREVSVGPHWFDAAFALDFFANMSSDNAQNEYYLTDAAGYASKISKKAGTFMVEADHGHGANDRAGLAMLNDIARREIIARHHTEGVDIPLPNNVIIGPDASIGADTVILPGCILRGKITIGEGCEIGPDTKLKNVVVGNRCLVQSSFIEDSRVDDNARIGPWCNIRPGCVVGNGAKIGDYVELKNANIGSGTSVAHLTYIGDSDVGSGCNFGCGVVTANYDGKNKHRTVIGDNCFIGCNCNLVPPVNVGSRVYAATGTTITDDVPDGALVIGRVRQEVKEGWADKKGLFNKGS